VKRRLARSACAALAALSLAFVSSPRAGADDAPGGGMPGMPALPPKISQKFATSLPGTWDLAIKVGAADAKPMSGVSVWSSACEGTAMLEEMRTGDGETAFFGMGVLTVGADEKSATVVWFDTDGGAGAWVFRGALTEDGWDLEGELPAHKPMPSPTDGKMKLAFHKQGEGALLKMSSPTETVFEITYTKAAKPVTELGTAAHPLKHPLADAMVGAWDLQGSFVMGGAAEGMPYTGSLAWRRACGGTGLVSTSEMTMGPMGVMHGLAVARIDPAAKVMNVWTWSDFEPSSRFEGTLTDTTWEAKAAEATPMGTMTMSLKKTDAGFETVWKVGDAMSGTEKLTKKP
jgi:hypothetical protein